MKKILQFSGFLLLLFVIAAIILYQVYDPEYLDIDSDLRAMKPEQFIELSQGFTEYEIAGPDTAELVVLVHGFSVPMYIWDKTYHFLLSKDYRVLRYSTLGRGLSTRIDGDYNNEAFRKQLHDLVEALDIKKPFHIAGLSFGGPIVADFAIHYPEKINKIIFIDPAYRNGNPTDSEFMMDYFMALDGTKRAEGQLADFKYPENYPEWPDLYRNMMYFNGHRRALISTIHHYKHIIENYAALNKDNFDIMLIWGEDDHVVPFKLNEDMRKSLDLRFEPIKDAAHLPHIEKEHTVNNLILDFLN